MRRRLRGRIGLYWPTSARFTFIVLSFVPSLVLLFGCFFSLFIFRFVSFTLKALFIIELRY